MGVLMMERMIRQNEMENLQIEQARVDGIINMKFITEYLHQRGVFQDQFPSPLLSGSLTMGWLTCLYEYD